MSKGVGQGEREGKGDRRLGANSSLTVNFVGRLQTLLSLGITGNRAKSGGVHSVRFAGLEKRTGRGRGEPQVAAIPNFSFLNLVRCPFQGRAHSSTPFLCASLPGIEKPTHF